MALISALSAFPKKMSRVTLRLGEESDPIALVAESGDPDLDGFVLLTADDHRIASAELSATPPASVPVPDKRKRTFIVTGRKPGSASILVWSSATRSTVDLGRIEVVVEDFKEKGVDLFYVGKYLIWRRSLPAMGDAAGFLMFDASSGSFPIASAQSSKDQGPIPEGRYTLLAQLDPMQNTVEKANALKSEGDRPGKGPFKNTRPGIQRLPVDGNRPENSMWGETRVRLDPLFQVPNGRTGFYLHDSKKGYTSGCVEVRRSDTGLLFFDALVSYALGDRARRKKNLILKVMYRDPYTSTRGRTVEP